MSYCKICGTEKNVKFRRENGRNMCDSCAEGMQPKLGKAEFEAAFWPDADLNQIGNFIRGEFYDEYLITPGSLEDYIKDTRG